MKIKRFRRVITHLFLICLAGGIYAAFATWTDLWIPCLFRRITGLKCPGCGVSHMCVALLHLDLKKAFSYNPAVFCLLPLFAVLLLKNTVQYIAVGRYRISRTENVMLAGSIVLLLLYGIVRNL